MCPLPDNYILKNSAELGLSQNLSTTEGIAAETVLAHGDKYQIDIYANMMQHKARQTPLLTLLANAGAESSAPPVIVFNDEYDGDLWIDAAFDTLRERNALGSTNTALPMSGFGSTIGSTKLPTPIGASTYKGGQLKIRSLLAVANDNTSILASSPSMTHLVDPTYTGASTQTMGQIYSPTNGGGTNKCVLAFTQDDNNTVGSLANVWERLHNLFTNLGYALKTGAGAGPITLTRYDYHAGVHAPVHIAIDDMYVAENADRNISTGALTSDIYQHNQVFALINKCGLHIDATGKMNLFIEIDFGVSNVDVTIRPYVAYSNGATAGVYDAVCVGIPVKNGTIGANTPDSLFLNSARSGAQYIGKLSRMVKIGQKLAAPEPIPEGDTFVAGGNFTAYRERHENYSQIFATPKYGITGTVQASNFRFGNDFIRTREKWLSLYKMNKEAAFTYGTKGETIAVNAGNAGAAGQPVRTVGGLLDYALFPINYMVKPLPSTGYTSTISSLEVFVRWIDSIADSITDFRDNSQEDIVFLASQMFLRRLIPFTRSISANGLMMAGIVNVQKPTSLNFGLEIYEFKSSSGKTVKFIHSPMLDMATSFPVPYWIFGTGNINPRNVLMSIDMKNVKIVNCRPDRIYGNIQEIGQDAFMEAMRGESSFMLRNPKNHTILYAPEA